MADLNCILPDPICKDPEAVLDYAVNWTSFLNGDTISESTWIVPDGITKDSNSNTDTHSIIWLSSGEVGTVYNLVNHIKTAAGREDDRTLRIKMVQK